MQVLLYQPFQKLRDVHSDRRKRRPYTAGNDHRFKAVIRHSRLRNGLHRTGKRRRFMPFPTALYSTWVSNLVRKRNLLK